VTPNDGIADGITGSESITIANTPPVIQSVLITPNPAGTQDSLTCVATTFDADGDGVSVAFSWTVDGQLQSAMTDTLLGPFQEGEVIVCEVTPSDGTEQGPSAQSSVIVVNSPPVLSLLTLNPPSPGTEDILTATVAATDPEGSSLTYMWEWFVDSGAGPQLVHTTSGSDSHSELDGLYFFDRDDLVYVELEVSDGSSSSLLTSTTLTVANTPPSVFNTIITPITPSSGEDLVCSAQSDDLDSDSISMFYSWEVNGQPSSTTSDTVSGASTASGEVWTCTVTPNDGDIDGSPQTASVTIDANNEAATGGVFCAAAGTMEDTDGYISFSCLSEQGIAGEHAQDSTGYTWQPGTHYLFSPE